MGRALDAGNEVSMSATKVLNMALTRWLLDFFLVYNILIGWLVVFLTECHVSLSCAWLVCLCDIVFFANSLGKWSERRLQTLPLVSDKSKPKARTTAIVSQVGLLLQITSTLAFVPYHILFILELDGPGLYAMICLLRLLWVARTQGVSISFFSNQTRKKTVRLAREKSRVTSGGLNTPGNSSTQCGSAVFARLVRTTDDPGTRRKIYKQVAFRGGTGMFPRRGKTTRSPFSG